MASLRYILISAISVFLLWSCKEQKQNITDRPILMVSVAPQKYLLSQLAGNEFEVITMLERGADPETFDPGIDRRIAADKAEAYFSTGVFPFENKIRESLPDGKMFVDTSAGIDFIYGTHHHSHENGEDHHEEEADPHVWTSVPNAKIIAGCMAETLKNLRPDSASVIDGRLSRLLNRLDSIDVSMRMKLENGDTVFAIWHPSLSYLSRDYGLEQIAVGQESKEMGAKRVREIIDNAKAKGVKVFFFQKEYDTRQAESINQGIGSTIVTIDPLSEDWEGQMTIIGNALSRP